MLRKITLFATAGAALVVALASGCAGMGESPATSRVTVRNNTALEASFGYSRAVRAGNLVQISGTTAWNEKGEITGIGDAYAQTRQALSNIESVLKRADASMSDVVRTRLYVTDASLFGEYAKAHSEFFRDIRPASLLVEVDALSHPDLMVEIEAEAIVADDKNPRELISSGTRWEPWFGYSRAVKAGNTIHVSGTTAWNEKGEIVGADDYYLQTRQSLANIKAWLQKSGAEMKDVVRTRVYTRDVGQFKAIAKAHREFFGNVLPSTTLLEIKRLAEPEMLVEIEAVAVTGNNRDVILTGTKWEPLYGYSRAVRAGNQVHVSATAAWDPATGKVDGNMDFEAQTRQILANLEAALKKAGARKEDVVRTRIYTTDASQRDAIGKAHSEMFGDIRPATLFVQVARMTEPEIKLEIELDAVITH